MGVAVVAGTAVVGERRTTPSRPHRTHRATVQLPAAPPQAAQSVGVAVLPVSATRVVRQVNATKPLHAVDDERSAGNQVHDGEAADGRAEHRDRAAGHSRHEASDQSGDGGERSRHASGSDENGARNTVTFQTETGDGNESGGSDHSSDSGSGDARETHRNSDLAPPGGLAPPGATQVTGLLPHDGRGLPAGD